MSTLLVDQSRAEIQGRLAEVRAEAAELESLLADSRPQEPEAEGSVIRFRKYNGCYSFAAIRTPNGSWYITQNGSRSPRQGHAPKGWDALLDWIGVRNWDAIEVLG